MFDTLMYLLSSAILVWLAAVCVGILFMPVYAWLRVFRAD